MFVSTGVPTASERQGGFQQELEGLLCRIRWHERWVLARYDSIWTGQSHYNSQIYWIHFWIWVYWQRRHVFVFQDFQIFTKSPQPVSTSCAWTCVTDRRVCLLSTINFPSQILVPATRSRLVHTVVPQVNYIYSTLYPLSYILHSFSKWCHRRFQKDLFSDQFLKEPLFSKRDEHFNMFPLQRTNAKIQRMLKVLHKTINAKKKTL